MCRMDYYLWNLAMIENYQINQDINEFTRMIEMMPVYVIVNSSVPIRNLQSVFPKHDVSPVIAEFIECMCDGLQVSNSLRKTITYFLNAMSENDFRLSLRDKSVFGDRQVNLINGLDYAITFEQAALDILDNINNLNIRIANRFLCYRFYTLNQDGSIVLYKHVNYEDFCDSVYGR